VKKVHRISRAISNFKSELPLTLSNGLLIIVISSLAEVASSKLLSIAEKKGLSRMGSPKNQGDRTDLQSIKRALESNSSIKTLLDSDLEINSHGLRLAERLLRYTDTPRDYEPQVIWLWGKTGTGKTRTAVSLLPDAYFKSNGVVNGGRIMTARRTS